MILRRQADSDQRGFLTREPEHRTTTNPKSPQHEQFGEDKQLYEELSGPTNAAVAGWYPETTRVRNLPDRLRYKGMVCAPNSNKFSHFAVDISWKDITDMIEYYANKLDHPEARVLKEVLNIINKR